jgi:hypothetical protein
MTDEAAPAAPDDRGSLWMAVVRWPLRGGMLGAVFLLTGIAYLLSRFESGGSPSARETAAMVQGGLALVAILVLGHYAWRAVACTFPRERPVPWGVDEEEVRPLTQRVTTFIAVLAISFAPLLAWLGLRRPIGAPGWLDAVVVLLAAAFGASMFPLGLAGAVARGTPLAALPRPVLRMWRAEPRAARIAWFTSLVFVGLFALSALVAALATKRMPNDAEFGGPGKDPMNDGTRWAIFALRAVAFYAALVSFRVAGLLVREVPGMHEASA